MKPLRSRKSAGKSGVSPRLLAWLCALVFLVSTLPLYIISLYNHPYYDDYGFSAKTRAVWEETGSLGQVFQAALESSEIVRSTWQGTYTGTFLSHFQPGLFSENLYFLTTFFLLTAFLLCFGFFLKAVFGDLLGLGGAESAALIFLTLTLLLQFMPDPDEAFFWFNGGVGNTFIYSLLALSLGLCVKLERASGRWARFGLVAALLLIMTLLGGGSYGGGVFGLLLYGLLCVLAFLGKSRWRFVYAGLTAVFLAGFVYSMSAPGNGVRAVALASQMPPVRAVLEALYTGVAVGAGYVRLPLLAVTILLMPFFANAARKSAFAFRHPWLLLLGGLCLYCTQFAPPLFSGVGIGGGRIVDTYYQSFVVLWLLYVFYLTGWWVRRGEALSPGQGLRPLGPYQGLRPLDPHQGLRPWTLHLPAFHAGKGVDQGLLLLCCGLLLLGCLGYKRPHDPMHGPQNMAGPSAALSLLRGEAQQYDREMTAREVLLRDNSQPEIVLAPLSVVPEIFMKDLLAPDAAYNVIPVLERYYGKDAIGLEGAP